ncbi:MAG: DNA topoisomerase IB [Candidatus Binatia bacterium]
MRRAAIALGNGRTADPVDSARTARLRYVTNNTPGVTRRKSGDQFVYRGLDGKIVRDPAELGRIKSLVIPPAWRDVWICPAANGHLQATGRDARGRKQHRYHPRWREIRDANKYDRMMDFAKKLPAIRRKVAEDLALPGLPREKVLATVARLLETSRIRVGNEEYARQNNSFGLATMRNRHVSVAGSNIRFEFRGKSGVHHTLDLNDRRLARIIKQCQELPGHELFQYIGDDGERYSIGSADVNDYLRDITGADFSSKDFRTWAGTVLAARALVDMDGAESTAQVKKNIAHAVELVAEKLGNTKAVCRKCYVHPAVLQAYTEGSLLKLSLRRRKPKPGSKHELTSEETAVLRLLSGRMRRKADSVNSGVLRNQMRKSLKPARAA